MNELKIIHFHGWADNTDLVEKSTQEFTHFKCELSHTDSIDQLHSDILGAVAPIVLIDTDLVTDELLSELHKITFSKAPICFFLLTNDQRTTECLKLLDLEVCGYLCLQDFNTHLFEQSLGLVYRNHHLKIKRLADLQKMQLLQTGLDQSANCVVITNKEGHIEYVNEAFEKLTGYTKKEVIGENPRVLKSGAQSDEYYKTLWETITAGKQWRGEFKNRKKDGSYYWERAAISPIIGFDGQINHFIAVKENITEEKRIRQAWQLSEERHKRAQQIGNIGHWVRDVTTNEIEWSEQTFKIYEKPLDFKPKVEDVIACMHPDDIDKVIKSLEVSSKFGIGNHVVHRIICPSGKIKYVNERWEVFKNEAQEITHFIGTCLDVTEQKELEVDLHHKSETLRSVLASMDDLVFVLDAEGNFFEFYQPNMQGKLLAQPKEFIGKHYSEILPPDVSKELGKKIQNVMKKRIIETFDYTLPMGAQERWYSAKISLIVSPEGKNDSVTIVSRDITEDRSIQKALEESEKRYKIQSELLPHVHWVSNAKGEMVYLNRKGKEFYGYDLSLEEISSWSTIHPDDLKAAKSAWEESLRTKTEYSNIERHRHHSGEFHWMQVNATLVLNDKSEIAYWIGIATDIDELITIRNEKDKLLFDLNERMKEVKCLYLISYLAQTWKGELNDFFNEILPVIAAGFTSPALTQVSITFKGKKYQSKPITYKNKITQDLIVSNTKLGEIVVAIPANENKARFLGEEFQLLLAVATNIASVIERAIQETEIQESQQKFETLVQNATIGIGILKEDKWVEANLTMETMFGAQSGELLGMNPWDLSPEFQPDGTRSIDKGLGMLKRLSGEEIRAFYWQHKHFDGTPVDCEIQLNKVLMNGEYHILAFLRDITKERAAIKRLVEKEAEYRNIFNNIQEGYMLLDLEGEIVSINPAGVKMIGADSAIDIIGTNSSSYFTSNIRELFTNSQLVDAGLLTNYELELFNSGGELRIVEFNLRLVKKENAPWLIETTFRDVTEKVSQERLKAATIQLYEAYEIGYDHLIQTGIDLAVDLLNSKTGFYHEVDEKQEMIKLVQWSKGSKEICQIPKLVRDYPFQQAGIWIEAIRTKKPVVHNDYKALNRKGALPKGHFEIIRDLEVPIINRGSVEAIIGVGNKEYPYTELDQQILLSYAQTFHSILSRKYAEEEYVKTLEIFNQAQQVGRIGAWRFDIVYNQTWWSDVMYDIYGLKSEDGIPENWLDFTHPDDRKPMEDAFNNALISGNYQCEYRLVRPNGLIRNIYAQAKVEFDAENKPKYYIGIAQDTTEITRALEQLHAKNLQFENIVASVPGIVYRFSYPDVELMYLSYYVSTLLGYTKRDFEENLNIDFVKSLIHPDDWDEITDQVLASFASSESYFLNYRMITATGQVIWVSNSGKIVNDGQGLILEGFVFDVTDRVKGEEKIMKAVMQASDNEKARISKEIHDSLQQTLTIASLNLGYLVRERDALSDKSKPKLDLGMEYLKKSLDDSREIAHRLLPKAIQDFGLVPVLEGMVDELNRTDNIVFHFNTNLHDMRIKLTIENNLYKIIQEAINNILKHAKAKVVTIQYMLLDNILHLSIEDDGVGFDTKLFKSKDLAGFGLASMRSRATAISAEFYIDSHPKHGTTLIIEMPFSKEIEYLEEANE
ncbi:MAG: hypothetical protein COW40_10355 [Cytophagales bacterium CG17_big_fil_post_rev_8_21_14_2_50_40_13]|nr:MAG: hypothetical protein COW40_10355 [Cytophagales bacterium CG17_big_fil_post_rev_8_21_14_2_50_40_13]